MEENTELELTDSVELTVARVIANIQKDMDDLTGIRNKSHTELESLQAQTLDIQHKMDLISSDMNKAEILIGRVKELLESVNNPNV